MNMNNQATPQEKPLLLPPHDFAAVRMGIKTETRQTDLQLDLITGFGMPTQSPTLSPDSEWIFACIKGINAGLRAPYACPQREPVRYLARESGQLWDSGFPLKGISVEPEQLGAITPEGAIDEGIELDPDVVIDPSDVHERLTWANSQTWRDYLNGGYDLFPIQSYISLWASIHGHWDPRQWVWVIRFENEA